MSYALQQTVQSGTAIDRAGTRPPRSRQDRHRDQRRRGRVVVVVRRLHAAGLDGGDVRARQGQRGAQRLPALVLRRRLPGRHLDRGHVGADGGRPGRGLPASRPSSTARRPATGHAPYTPPPPSRPEPTQKQKPSKPKQQPTKPNKPDDVAARRLRRRPTTPTAPDDGAARHDPRDELRARRTPPAARDRAGGHDGEAVPHVTVAPTRADPFARSMSEVIGGPVGRHAPAAPLVGAGARAAGAVRRGLRARAGAPRALPADATGPATRPATARCATPTSPTSTPGAGYAEGRWPYADTDGRYEVMEYPVGISYLAWGAAKLTQLDPVGPPIEQRRNADPGRRLVPAGDDDRGEQLLPGHRAAAGALRAARDLVPGRHPSRTTVGRAVRSCSRPPCC